MSEWQARDLPPNTVMQGNYCRVEPIDIEKHAEDLYHAFAKDNDHSNWTYLPYGPFNGENGFDKFKTWIKTTCTNNDPLFHTIIDLNSEKAVGIASLMRIEPEIGVIEVGHIHFSPLMQRTPIATEAIFLMMKRVFDELGYRRFEWKCDSLNAPSCKAAKRFGFVPEGIFRQVTMYKNRSRDTAWFSIIDSEWPTLKKMFEAWLTPENFDENQQQINKLQFFRKT
ncbi:UNVERIFIED_CONTAM: hypothetical protein GTU68_065407 [Idotea baltica]|nr:hypothetical protein [Idotea baltica]